MEVMAHGAQDVPRTNQQAKIAQIDTNFQNQTTETH